MRLFCVSVNDATAAAIPVLPSRLIFPATRRPARAGRRGRKPKWTPHALTQADINRGKAILDEWGVSHDNRDRIRTHYETMCHLSGMEFKNPLAAIGFLGQMVNAGLGPGTCDTYVGYVHSKYWMQNVLKAASARHADHEGKHAPDIADDILWKYVVGARDKWQPILWVMFVGGLRPRAIRFLRRRRIGMPTNWAQDDLEFSVMIDKTRRRRALRAILTLPAKWKWRLAPPSKTAEKFLREGDQDVRLFEGVKATDINRELTRLSKSLDLPRPTTYSFRRAYINRIYPLVRNKTELTEKTLHFEVSTVEAFYRRTKHDAKNVAR